MTAPDRQIDVFPYSRANAEKLVALTQNVVVNYRAIWDFTRTLPDGPDDLRTRFYWGDSLFLGANLYDVEEILERTFPELSPFPWNAEVDGG